MFHINSVILVSGTLLYPTFSKNVFSLPQECVPENEDLKRKVFGQLEQYADDATVLCSSTSCIIPSKFTDHLKRRNQCIVAHPVSLKKFE